MLYFNKFIPYAKSGILIKPENRGKFTEYCHGKVTEECINRGKHSSDPAVRKRATFADNARHWVHSHQQGGSLFSEYGKSNTENTGLDPGVFSSYQAIPMLNEEAKTTQITLPNIPTPTQSTEPSEIDEALTKANDWYSDFKTRIQNYMESKRAKSEDEPINDEIGSKTVAADGPDRDLYIYNWMLENLDLSPTAAAGIVANLIHESGLKTDIVAKPSSRGGKYFSGGDTGLAQWTGSRKKAFESRYGKPVAQGSLDELLDFIRFEILSRPVLYNQLKLVQDVRLATELVLRGFENGSATELISPARFYSIYRHSLTSSVNSRLKSARKFLNKLK